MQTFIVKPQNHFVLKLIKYSAKVPLCNQKALKLRRCRYKTEKFLYDKEKGLLSFKRDESNLFLIQH